MKVMLKLELRDDSVLSLMRFYTQFFNDISSNLGRDLIGPIPRTWVAEITGRDPKYRYARNFLPFKKDYSLSNSKGTRGIYAIYILDGGKFYEVKYWKERYFCTVTDWKIEILTKDNIESLLPKEEK
jgi:hypothetical protein